MIGWIRKYVSPSLSAIFKAYGGDIDEFMKAIDIEGGEKRWKGRHRAMIAEEMKRYRESQGVDERVRMPDRSRAGFRTAPVETREGGGVPGRFSGLSPGNSRGKVWEGPAEECGEPASRIRGEEAGTRA